MDRPTLGRREMLMGTGAAVGGAALTGLGASPVMASDNGGDLSGSWLVTRMDDPPGDPTPVKAVLSFAAGDVFVSHDINPAGPPFTGTWKRDRDHGFRATMWTGQAGGGPGAGPGPTIRVQLRGSTRHDSISGTYEFTVFDAVTDAVLDSGTGAFSGTPIDA